jgi:DNA-binding NtrC family response regulator
MAAGHGAAIRRTVLKEGRMLPLVAPALVLYLAVELGAASGGIDAAGWTLVIVAGALSLVPFFAMRNESEGARRIAWLGALSAAVLVAHADLSALSLTLEVVRMALTPFIGALALDLALDIPDRPAGLARLTFLRRAAFGVASIASLIGIASALGPFSFAPDRVVPDALVRIVPVSSVVMVAVALGLRIARRRLGSTPEALAASAGAATGTSGALAFVALHLGLVLFAGEAVASAVSRGLVAASLASIVLGHLSIRSDLRPVGAALATRRVVSAFVTLVGIATLVARYQQVLPVDRIALGVVSAAGALAAALLYAGVRWALERLLAPDGGRLLAAVAAADARSSGARELEELGSAVLAPLRAAARLNDAEPVLFALDPERAVRIDLAGQPHVATRSLSPALVSRMLARRGEIVLRAPLEGLVVRRPDLRPIVESLQSLDAIAVVPLVDHGETEGALVVPRGLRRSALTLEELAALEALAARIAPTVGLLSASARAQQRTGELLRASEKLEDRIDALEDELARARAEAARVTEGAAGTSAAPLVAYGPEMRAVVSRLDEIATVDAPVLLVAEPGVQCAPLVRRLHEGGPRKMGPIVVIDCANVRPEQAELALFGDDLRNGTPGWLRLAAGGTLFLEHATALGMDTLRALDEAIAARMARSAMGGSPYAVDVRIVVGVNDDPSALIERTSLDPGLADRLRALRIDVPPLRARALDLGSLVLFAIDRACRASGSATLGIDEEALAELTAHGWPGNESELFAVIERAVRRATPPRITKADVGLLVVRETEDQLGGSLADIERRALESALARANGNKSEAARILGVARTTFLDKVKRAGIDLPEDRSSKRPSLAPKPAQTVPPKKIGKTSAA